MVSPRLKLSALQQEILLKISQQLTASGRDIERSRIILALSSGFSNLRVENELGYSREKAKRCRDRWLLFQPVLDELEADLAVGKVKVHDLGLAIKECLGDAPRSGGPLKFSATDFCQMLAVSLEDPKQSDRPISHWSLGELKNEIEKRGIVSSISRSHLGDFLKSERCKAAQDGRVAQP
jgi:hypothetical protein